MGARSGSNYLSTLKKLNAEMWLGGERVAEVTSHPAFRNCARSIASLYDMQMERVEQMTYRTDDGGRSGLSFIQPKSIEELRKRSRMMAAWANFSGGTLAHTPDYFNAGIAAMAAARDFFAASDPNYGTNIGNYYLEARKHDWCGTIALDDTVLNTPRIMDDTSTGIVITRLMRAPLAPFAEELLVLPPPNLSDDAASQPLAIAFAISSNTKGVKLLCQDPIDTSRSRFDAPLASRFAQHDCLVHFDHVTVPWERVFLCGDVTRCRALLEATGAGVQMRHQAVVKDVAKAEFMLGLAVRLAEVTDAINSPQVRERIGEMIMTVASMRAGLRDAEADAALDKWGIIAPARVPLDAARALFTGQYARMVEAIRLIGGPHLTAISSAPAPPLDAGAREREALYRLALDATSNIFAESWTLSERGDPAEFASDLIETTDLTPLSQRIKDFLHRTD